MSSTLGTRAVSIRMGHVERFDCSHCGEEILFAHDMRVVANVYKKGQWDRLENFHVECYAALGTPYGEATLRPTMRKRKQ